MERTTTFCFKFSTSADPGLDDGSISKRPPVEGRKRCSEHKGKKTTGSSTRSSMKSQPHKEDYPEIEHCSPICGVAMDDGSVCRRQPVPGRKRCDLHKGRRIYSSDSVITRYQTMPYAVFNSYSDEKASVFYENHTGMTIPTLVFGPSHAFDLPAMVLPAREQYGYIHLWSTNPQSFVLPETSQGKWKVLAAPIGRGRLARALIDRESPFYMFRFCIIVL
ncbi:hypothetical protein GOBAR_AA39243 [Gossypium barbadense]|uniref:Uncharacterized protein n=1 Tax=Gossypium barbadense TaxID=3634 RepID=A0A2P5VRN0_GOSBA|nr:hypothetical protein GOBAR_AA39243 [Gossypium barbadense]